MRKIFARFLVAATVVLGQEPYISFANAQTQEATPEADLIVLVSHLVALGIDCSFKINNRELDRLVGLKGFKIEDFLPNGRFSARVAEQIVNARELVKSKGCRIASDIILNDFPDIGNR